MIERDWTPDDIKKGKDFLKKLTKQQLTERERDVWGKRQATAKEIEDALKRGQADGQFKDLERLFTPTPKDLEDKLAGSRRPRKLK